MFEFKSPVIPEHIWKISLKTPKEMLKIYYEDRPIEQEKIEGITEYIISTIYIDETLDDKELLRTLRKQLMRLYLFETGQQNRKFTEEEFCDLMSVASPLICKTANRLKRLVKGENK